MTDHFMDLSYLYFLQYEILDLYADRIAESELSKIQSPVAETNLFIAALPEFNYDCLEKIFERLAAKGFKSINILVNDQINLIRPLPEITSTTVLEKCKIIPILYHPWWCMKEMEQKNLASPKWNPDIRKGLLRTGNLNRYTRIGILKLLYDHNLLDKIVWTLPNAERQKINVLKYFAKWNNNIPKNFEEFYEYVARHAITNPNSILIKDVDPKLKEILPNEFFTDWFIESFAQANFSIISESDFSYGAISEKSYLTMLHKHPFIIVNTPKHVEKLKQLGFKTFENYLPCDHYINIEDDRLRLDLIIENIRSFQKIIEDRKEEIAADVEHNYNLCLQMAAETERQLKNLSDVLTADNLLNLNFLTFSNVDLDLFIEYKKQDKILWQEKKRKEFLEKYNVYKGADWPEIHSESDFEQLPEWVKQEAKTKFDFPRDLINRNIINAYLQDNR